MIGQQYVYWRMWISLCQPVIQYRGNLWWIFLFETSSRSISPINRKSSINLCLDNWRNGSGTVHSSLNAHLASMKMWSYYTILYLWKYHMDVSHGSVMYHVSVLLVGINQTKIIAKWNMIQNYYIGIRENKMWLFLYASLIKPNYGVKRLLLVFHPYWCTIGHSLW